MSILGEARKRLERANMIKSPVQEQYVSTRIPYTSDLEPTCPDGYHYDDVAKTCVPDAITPATPGPVAPIESGDSEPMDPNHASYLNADEAKSWISSGAEHGYYGTIQDAIKDAKKGNPKAQAAIDSMLAKDPKAGRSSPKGILGRLLHAGVSSIPGRTLDGTPINRMDLYNHLLGTGSGPVSNRNAYDLGIDNIRGGIPNEPDFQQPDVSVLGDVQKGIGNIGHYGGDDNNDNDHGGGSSVGGEGGLDNSSSVGSDGGGWTNQGGYVNQGGFPGEPKGTDNVPTWLTPGEFVVDKDSAQKYGPLLEKINAEEPMMGTEAGVMSQLDDLINKHSGV